MAKQFKKEFQTKFSQSDQAGVLFFAELPKIAHDHFEEALQSLSVGWQEWFSNSEFAAPIRHCEVDFKGPLFAGKTYQSITTLRLLSDTELETTVEFKSNDRLLASVVLKQVFIDPKKRERVQLPASLRERIS